MSELQDDSKIISDGRSDALVDKDDLKVSAPLRDQLSDRLISELNKQDMGKKIVDMWTNGNSHRSKWLQRQQEYLTQIDEFIDPIYESATDWGSVLHLPTILSVCKTMHSRMFAAIMGIDPPFTMRARKGANASRAMRNQNLMRYTLTDYCNEYRGVRDEVDAWVWEWCTAGQSFLKPKWLRKYTRFEDIQEVEIPSISMGTDNQGNTVPVETIEIQEEIVEKEEKVFDGPILRRVAIENLVVIGGNGDPDEADSVIERDKLTASDLWSLVDQKIFKKAPVERLIERGRSSSTSDPVDGIQTQKKLSAGENELSEPFELDRYDVLEAYVSACVDGSGINSDLIVWVAKDTKEIVRATYLRRAMKTGMRPYAKASFHKRHDANHDVGLVELLHSLGKELDAMHNMRIDTGILTSLPWGFYRPTNAFNAEKMPISPGDLIPTSDPQRDVFFPNLGNRTSFAVQEEASLMNMVERLTSINELSYGQVQGQGFGRTATGASLLAGEANANLDIYLQRLNKGWKKALVYTWHMLQQNIPDGLEYRVLGDDGDEYFDTIEDREELAGMFDFELEANSSNSNPTLQKQMANQIYQMTQNPLDLQMGLITPQNRYEALKSVALSIGVKDIGKYFQKPNQILRVFTPMEIADRILAGVDVPLDPTQDLQGFITFVQLILSEDDLLGQFSQNDVAALVSKMQEAQGLIEALQAAQNDQQVFRQQSINQAALFGGGLQGRIEADSAQGVI